VAERLDLLVGAVEPHGAEAALVRNMDVPDRRRRGIECRP
jgi:hypothetical protein